MDQIRAVLFDLDGTLLPMDQDEFVAAYLRLLCQTMAPLGYDPARLQRTVWEGVGAMARNDGSRTNQEAFWQVFADRMGPERLADEPAFLHFYAHEFQGAQEVCGRDPQAAQVVRLARELGFRVALATNPLFPQVATQSRVRWAGLEPGDFELITCYEDSRTCKPNPAYFVEVAGRLGVPPQNCLVVGNDAVEDLAAAQAGMQVFLLTPCLINPKGIDLEPWPHGDFDALARHLRRLAGEKNIEPVPGGAAAPDSEPVDA